MPRFEGIGRGDVTKGTLGDVMLQSGVKLGRGGKAGLGNDVIDAAIKTFNHAIGLRMRGDDDDARCQEVTLFVKGVLTSGRC